MITTQSLLQQIEEMRAESEVSARRYEQWMKAGKAGSTQPSLTDIMQVLQALLAEFTALKTVLTSSQNQRS